MSGLTNAQRVTSVAAAVSAALAGVSTAQGQALEEIIVTATKKAQSLQSIAGAVDLQIHPCMIDRRTDGN